MTGKFCGLVLAGLVTSLVGGCGADDKDTDDATGSAECSTVRRVCSECLCPDAQETTGLQDRKRPCELLLEQWEADDCFSCQYGELHGC